MRWMILLSIATMASWALCPQAAAADTPADEPTVLERTTPYVAVQIGFELQAIEGAARDVANSVDELSASMQTLTDSPSLSEDQKAELMSVLGRVDQLSERVVDAVDRIPDAVEQSRGPLTGIATDLAHDARRTLVLALAAVLVVIVLALLAAYVFTIRPAGQAIAAFATRLTSLAKSVEHSIDLVAQTNEVQLELARILETQREAIEAFKAPTTDPEP